MDTEKLSYSECVDIATDIICVETQLHLFLSNGNRIFSGGNTKDEPVSDLYREIVARTRSTNKDVLIELLEQLCQRPGWSRSALVETLTSSNLCQVARKWLAKYPIIKKEEGLMNNFTSLSNGTIIVWLTQQLSLHEDTRLKLVYQKVDGAFLSQEFARGTLLDTLRAAPFSIPYGTASNIVSLTSQAMTGKVVVQLGPRLIDADLLSKSEMAATIAAQGSESVLRIGYSVVDYLAECGCKAQSAEVLARLKERQLSNQDKAQMMLNMLCSAVPRTSMLQLRRIFQVVGENSLAEESIFSDSPPSPQGSPMHHYSSATSAPLLQTMEQRNAVQTMTAVHLLQQTQDADLEDLVNQLWSALRRDEAWHKYAHTMGATASDEAKAFIKNARATGRPERAVVMQIAQKPGYTALSMLVDFKKLGFKSVNGCVEAIESHLACKESAVAAKTDEASKSEDVLRQWIISQRLCANETDIDARVEGLKRFGAHTLEDLEIMDKEDFTECGFPGLAAKKAEKAPKKIGK